MSDPKKSAIKPTSLSTRITVRVAQEDFDRYSAAAKWMGLSLSDFFRHSLNSEALTYRSTPRAKASKRKEQRKVNPELLRELNKMGNNLNQIAKALNKIQLIDGGVSGAELLHELVRIERHHAALIAQNEAGECEKCTSNF